VGGFGPQSRPALSSIKSGGLSDGGQRGAKGGSPSLRLDHLPHRRMLPQPIIPEGF